MDKTIPTTENTNVISAEIGKMPEEAVFIGEKKVSHVSIEVIEYDKKGEAKEFEIENIRDILPLNEHCVTWINVVGIHDSEHIKEIGALFNLHPLAVEDILNTEQYPKFEDYDDYIFFITKMLRLNPNYNPDDPDNDESMINEQVSLILGETFVLSFQEIKADVFAYVRQRLRKKKGRIFRSGADYLAYQLLDAVLENYIVITESITDKIEDLEDGIADGVDEDIVYEMSILKKELNYLRRIIRPTNDFILKIMSLETDLIKEPTEPFFKDLLDIAVRANSSIETCRDMLSDNLQIYNLDASNRFNETLRFLTVFTALFAPLTFIVGVYGMNFKNMPEIESFEHGYLAVWLSMVAIVGIMLLYFRRKKWI